MYLRIWRFWLLWLSEVEIEMKNLHARELLDLSMIALRILGWKEEEKCYSISVSRSLYWPLNALRIGRKSRESRKVAKAYWTHSIEKRVDELWIMCYLMASEGDYWRSCRNSAGMKSLKGDAGSFAISEILSITTIWKASNYSGSIVLGHWARRVANTSSLIYFLTFSTLRNSHTFG